MPKESPSFLQQVFTVPGVFFPDSFSTYVYTAFGLIILIMIVMGALSEVNKEFFKSLTKNVDRGYGPPLILIIGFFIAIYPITFSLIYYAAILIGIPYLFYLLSIMATKGLKHNDS